MPVSDQTPVSGVPASQTKARVLRRAFAAAFPCTLPILAGFSFLSMAYGIYMNVSGFPFVYPMLMAMLIFGGSLEFVTVSMLLSPFAPLQAFLVAVMVQSRHLFYGLSMLDRYKNTGFKKWFLIFGMCDETFSVNYTAKIPEGVDHGWFYFFVTLLDYLYWVLGAAAGGLLGSLLSFDTEGLGFVMTAMFVVIFLEQWKKERVRTGAAIGFGASVLCLLLFGPDSFLIPTLILILLVLTLLRKKLAPALRAGKEAEEA